MPARRRDPEADGLAKPSATADATHKPRPAIDFAITLRSYRGHPQLLRNQAARPDDLPAFTEGVLITDITAHQHDIYGALEYEGDRTSAGIRIGISFYLGELPWQPALPGLRVDAGDKTYACGTGEPRAGLRTDRFTLFRALSGRRSADQIRALDWTGDPDPYLGMFAPYGQRQTPLYELATSWLACR